MSGSECLVVFPQVVLTQLAGQDLHVEIFDKDMDMKDDFMGRWVLLQ